VKRENVKRKAPSADVSRFTFHAQEHALTIYHRYAEIYDRSGQITFSLRMIPYLLELLERHGFEGQTMLDLACGTGTVALAFATRGWRVYGLDASEAMLAEARRKSEEAGVPLLLSQQDMRSFILPERVDLITCLFDSLNYLLTTEDLQRAFSQVVTHLAPGGLFVCDMNSIWALSEIWDHNTYFSESEDLSIIMQSDYDGATHVATVRMVAFIRRGALFERIEETHVERGYSERTVSGAMDRAGLQVLAIYECFTFDAPGSRSPRVLWLAAPAARELEA
jgi:SAM-dependent methyltransferase